MKSISSPSEKRPDAKRKSSSETSKTDWARLETMKDEDIDLTPDHPEADIAHIRKGIVRHGLRPAPGQDFRVATNRHRCIGVVQVSRPRLSSQDQRGLESIQGRVGLTGNRRRPRAPAWPHRWRGRHAGEFRLPSYEDALHRLAEEDERLIVMTAENRAAIRTLPERLGPRFIDVGIAEQTLVGMAAGLAVRGRIPVIHALAAFLTQRAFEFIRIDVGIPGLPVKLVGSFPGFVSEANGPTHQAIEDVALMRGIPNMKVFCPADLDDLLIGLDTVLRDPAPYYIRYNAQSPVRHPHPRLRPRPCRGAGRGPGRDVLDLWRAVFGVPPGGRALAEKRPVGRAREPQDLEAGGPGPPRRRWPVPAGFWWSSRTTSRPAACIPSWPRPCSTPGSRPRPCACRSPTAGSNRRSTRRSWSTRATRRRPWRGRSWPGSNVSEGI